MWLELHDFTDGSPQLIQTEHIVAIGKQCRDGKRSEAAWIQTSSSAENEAWHVAESYGQIRMLLVGIDTIKSCANSEQNSDSPQDAV